MLECFAGESEYKLQMLFSIPASSGIKKLAPRWAITKGRVKGSFQGAGRLLGLDMLVCTAVE
jgi:hypothetical protein